MKSARIAKSLIVGLAVGADGVPGKTSWDRLKVPNV